MRLDRIHARSEAVALLLAVLASVTWPAGVAAQNFYGYPDEPDQRVRYDVVHDEIAVRFGKPLAAGSLADTVSKAAWADGICAADGSKPQLVYKGSVNSAATDVARFAIVGCSATDRALLARAIIDNVADATAAGLVISIYPTGRRAVLTDNLIIELAAEGSTAQREFGEFQLNALDPFAAGDRFYFRLYDQACVIDLTSTDCRDHGRCRRGGACRRKDLVGLLQTASTGGTFRGQQVTSVVPDLIPLTPSEEDKGFDSWLEGQKTSEDDLTGTISVSFTGNEASSESDFKLGSDIKLNRGSYPGQLRVGAGAQVQFKDNVVEENVTKLQVSYDYYFERWLEVYGFMERFSNSFLSIEQRYESGAGVLLEWDAKRRDDQRAEFCVGVPGPVHYHRGEKKKAHREILVTKKAQAMLDVYRQRLRAEARDKGEVSEETKKEFCRYKLGIQKRHARVQSGLAISLFGDFEQPDELTISAEPIGDQPPPEEGGPEKIEVKVRPPSAHRFRVTLRPTVTLRPNNRAELFAHYYFKLALDEPQVPSDLEPSGEAGRQEFLVGAKITLASDETGGQKVALSLSAEQFHDRFPPSVIREAALAAFGGTEMLVADLSFLRDGIRYAVPDAAALTARRTHTVYKFALTVSW